MTSAGKNFDLDSHSRIDFERSDRKNALPS
jgi:hypothetical protein